MKKLIKLLPLIFFILAINSCKISNNKESSIDEKKDNIEKTNSKKEQIEVRFSCGENDISKYKAEGWNIVKEYSEEKICTWKSFPASKDCDMEKDKGCKITTPDEIGEETIYLLER